MRWSGQSVTATRERQSALPGLGLAEMAAMPGHLRTVRSPDFKGMVFHEVLAKSALNKVPGASSMPFSWTVNPYRGCSHACVYCFARGSHRYLDLDSGRDFDSQIVVKVNVAEVLSRELTRPSWQGEYVALGTNTDPYQRAEGRYALMPGIIDALGRSNTPLSILTKGTLLRRDLAIGAEVRFKPDNLQATGRAAGLGSALREDAWKDIFIAWAPTKNLSLTLAWADLGRVVPGITNGRRQSGAYLSAQVAF